MSGFLRAARFFQIVGPVPRMMHVSAVAVGASCGMLLIVEPDRGFDALTPVLVLQVFAVSAGFASAARRGHYDFILTSGVDRVSLALAHWLSSATPGALVWMALAGVEALRSGHPPTILNPGSIVAMWIVSTVPWAITVALPRFSGAIGWTFLATVITVFIGPATERPWRGVDAGQWSAAWTVLIWPSQLAGRDLSRHALAAASGISLSTLAMVAAFFWIHRTDVRLEAGQ